jgi:hypothetical protein
MDEETRLTPPDHVAPTDVEKPASTGITNAALEVAQIVTALDIIAERLQLEHPHPSTARSVRAARTVPREFVVSTIESVDALPDLEKLGTLDTDEARQVLEKNEALRVLTQRVEMFLAAANYTIESRWSKLVSAAMVTYSIASIKAQDPANAEMAAHVEVLRRHLGRKGGKKKKKDTAEEERLS